MKVSSDRNSAQEVTATRPQMVEVWYNATRPDDYSNLFAFLKRQPLDTGLHYWGVLPNGLLTNIAYPDPNIWKPSLALIRATIDTAARNHFSYVNIHTDMRALLNVNFSSMQISVASKPAQTGICIRTYLENVASIKTYAEGRGIVLTVETIPQRDTTSWKLNRDRRDAVDLYQLPIDVQLELAARRFAIANDFAHTACNVISEDRGAVWRFLYDTTKTLAAATRLIHFGFIIPPYNGVDFHDSLDNQVLNSVNAIPNKKQMMELLKLFDNRDDVWILVEPKADHVKNYFLAKKILLKAGVLTKQR